MMNWDAFKNHDGTYYVHREYNKPMPDAELGQEAPQNRKKFKKLRTVSGDELMKKNRQARPLCCQRIASPRTEYRRGQA